MTPRTPHTSDCLSARVRRAIRRLHSLHDEAVGCEAPRFTEEQLDFLERRFAEVRFALEEPAAPCPLHPRVGSPTPWSYDYSPYRRQDGVEVPAFEVYDANFDKVFDTNEETPCEVQERNARLAAAAPALQRALGDCLRLLGRFDDHDGEVGRVYHKSLEALVESEGSAG